MFTGLAANGDFVTQECRGMKTVNTGKISKRTTLRMLTYLPTYLCLNCHLPFVSEENLWGQVAQVFHRPDVLPVTESTVGEVNFG